MTFATILSLLPALFAWAGMQVSATQRVRSITVEQQLVVRVPVRPLVTPRAIEWTEHKGPKCIPIAELRGAMLSGRDNLDFVMDDRRRVRAELDDDCPTLDFYGGFYLKPRSEDELCAKRDAIYSRIGGSCTIEKFRNLVPKARQ